MPVFGMRFKEGLIIKDERKLKDVAFNNRNRARHLLYNLGEHDVTPRNLLWPQVTHRLEVFEVEGEEFGLYKPVTIEGAVIVDFDDVDEAGRLNSPKKALHQLINFDSPVAIARPVERSGIQELLLLLYSSPYALFTHYEVALPESRRNLVQDVQMILSESNGQKMTERALLKSLLRLDSFYRGRPEIDFKSAVSAIVKSGYIESDGKANPTFTLPKQR